MSRSYKEWIKALSKKLNIIIRHDVDFDIHTTRKMLEIEKEHGVRSITYVDIHSPSYSHADIINLYKDFSKDGFLFGIHINTAYDYDHQNEAIEAYMCDIEWFKRNQVKLHSCAGHMYDVEYALLPKFTNVDIENYSSETIDYPNSFYKSFFDNRICKSLRDSGKGGWLHVSEKIEEEPFTFINSIAPTQKAYVLFHPVHYYTDGDDVIFAKRMGGTGVNLYDIEYILKDLEITPYLAKPIEQIEHLTTAIKCVRKIIKERYRELLTMVDAGCGMGLLGAYMMGYNNLKYTGIDTEKRFIDAGKKMFEYLGYCPRLIVNDIYSSDFNYKGDIFICLATDDCPTDYNALYDKCRDFSDIMITIPTLQLYEKAKKNNKHYYYIEPQEFQGIFERTHKLMHREVVRSRHFFWYRRKQNEDKSNSFM